MKILAIDTSSVCASAALCEDGFLCGEFYINIRQTHSETLLPEVDDLLLRCGCDLADIGLYSAAVGPGSFTGVRIGVSAVKGLALSRSVPCAAVSTLEAAALNFPYFDGIVCCVMDARRSQVYNALFDCSGGMPERLTPDRALSIEDLGKELVKISKKTVLVGDGADLCYNTLREIPGLLLAPEPLRYQKASSVAQLGYQAFRRGLAVSAEELSPLYLRLPQAERELRSRTQATQN